MKQKTDQVKSQRCLLTVGRLAAAGVGLILVVLGSVIPAQASTADQTSEAIESAMTAMEKWVETKRILSQEKRDFVLARQMLQERIRLVQREIASLKEKIAEAEASIAQADERRAEMMVENDRYKAVNDFLVTAITSLERRTRDMLPQLPEPLRQRIQPLSHRLPQDPEKSKVSIAERFQNVVGILNEVNKFNRDITVTSEVRALPDGTSMEVAVLYVGLGQAFYVSANRTIAGIGTATNDGWAWPLKNETADAIAEAISILKNEKAASFVLLPVTLDP